jgi:hypothetical protein
MPRHSGNRNAADRPNSSVHGGFSKAPASATRYSFRASSSWSTIPVTKEDARPIHSSSTPADSRLIAAKIVASATRRGYAGNGQLTVFSTIF